MIQQLIWNPEWLLAGVAVLAVIAWLLRPRRTSYQRYLNSFDWDRTRLAAKRRDGFRCRACGVRKTRFNRNHVRLHAHHVSYWTWRLTGRTPIRDLVTLCDRDHARVHAGRGVRIHSLTFWALYDLACITVVLIALKLAVDWVWQ